MPLDGFFAMEIFNTGCVTEGNYDFNTQAYEDMLRAGKRVFAVAADDNHNGSRWIRSGVIPLAVMSRSSRLHWDMMIS